MDDRAPLYVPAKLGTNALKRLGGRIASGEALTADEQALYESFIRDAATRVEAVQLVIEELVTAASTVMTPLVHAEIVARVKTLSTLGDKLRRSPSEKLPSVHDVAGLRIVADISPMEQTILVNRIKEFLDEHVPCSRESVILDRRETPSWGYRAVHVISWPGGRPVEIQMRTALQHAWAQLMEITGDRWGREPRYGMPVTADRPEVREYRQRTVDLILETSGLIASIEGRADRGVIAHLSLTDDQLVAAGADRAELGRIRTNAIEHERERERSSRDLLALLDSLRKNIER